MCGQTDTLKGANRQKGERKKERKMKRRNKNSPRLWRVKKKEEESAEAISGLKMI